MTTTNIRYVDPDADAGGDGTTNGLSGANCAYASLSIWEAARNADLVAGDLIEKVYCDSNGGSHTADTSVVVINGWTTGANNYISINGNISGSTGIYSTSKYRLEGDIPTTGLLTIMEDYVRVNAMQIHGTSTAGNSNSHVYVTGQSYGYNDIRISNTIVKGIEVGISYSEYLIRIVSSNAIVKIWNSLIYGCSPSYTGRGIDNSGSLYLYNDVIQGGSTRGLYSVGGGTLVFKNTYACSAGGTAFAGGTMTMTNCASSDSTAIGTNPLHNIALDTNNFTNVTVGSENFHLPGVGSALYHAGVDTSGDSSPLNFTTDIDGDTYASPRSIGADEYIAAGATPLSYTVGDDASAVMSDGMSGLQPQRAAFGENLEL